MKLTKYIIVLLTFLSVISCSKEPYIEENIDVPANYLEESQLNTTNKQKIHDDLIELQKVKPADYTIGCDDKFNTIVYGEDELNAKSILVKKDGCITYPLCGEVKVKGLTMTQAKKAIEDSLRNYIKNPNISLIPFEINSGSVTVLGKVTYPNRYKITGDMRILDVISMAGGLALGYFMNNSVELADLEHTTIIRDGKALPVDFDALIKRGKMINNIPVLDGDYIYLPSGINKEIFILGEVNKQGHYYFTENMTLVQAIAYAQGLTVGAKTSNVFVVRGNLSQPRLFKINAKAIYSGKMRDFRLKANDIIYVPKTILKSWNDVLAQIMPSFQAVSTGWMINDVIKEFNK